MGQRARRRGHLRGAAMVELILLLPVFMLMLMVVLEFGLVAGDYLLLDRACSDGARTASLGKPLEEIRQAILKQAPPGVRPESIRIECLQPQTNASGQETGGYQDP